MKREIIKIDEEKCNGCGLCIPNCHEGALQIIDGKARLISDLMCDGLGACIGHCPEGAMELEVREAQPYDEIEVMKEMVNKGANVVIAHMKHLKDHGEFVFLKQAVNYLMENENNIEFPVREVIQEVHFYKPGVEHAKAHAGNSNAGNSHSSGSGEPAHHAHQQLVMAGGNGGGCPGSRSMNFGAEEGPDQNSVDTHDREDPPSQLRQWPLQLHLINPAAAHFQNSDLLLAADCVAYSIGNFHQRYLRGKTLAIACPKLDANKEVYLEKMIRMVDQSQVNTITVMKMEVPCCFGIEQLAVMAVQQAGRKVPVKSITVGIRGDILDEQWL